MSSKRIERQIDDALLAAATGTGFLYARRRVRRLLHRAAIGAMVIAGVSVVGVAGAGAAWYRRRTGTSAPEGWRQTTA